MMEFVAKILLLLFIVYEELYRTQRFYLHYDNTWHPVPMPKVIWGELCTLILLLINDCVPLTCGLLRYQKKGADNFQQIKRYVTVLLVAICFLAGPDSMVIRGNDIVYETLDILKLNNSATIFVS